eukprot:TRINITY_DN870_c0_g1_i1.p1 TRINITY_DN870_c0_g1~~TRINITY_DN870_c0_g1_i1.p1  ORF type:complete len:135 (-),score=33.63 TRINITY_DN870_c0_g1_i1:264-668(-)
MKVKVGLLFAVVVFSEAPVLFVCLREGLWSPYSALIPLLRISFHHKPSRKQTNKTGASEKTTTANNNPTLTFIKQQPTTTSEGISFCDNKEGKCNQPHNYPSLIFATTMETKTRRTTTVPRVVTAGLSAFANRA